MPLKKGSSKETISKNIETEVKKFNKTGKVGTSKPANKKKAVKQAAAIAYAKAGKDKKNDENSESIKKKKAKQDFDGDGKLESPEQEYRGSKDRAIKNAKGRSNDENSEKTIKESFQGFVKSTLRKLFALE